jgi:methionyl-tRNA synthetase
MENMLTDHKPDISLETFYSLEVKFCLIEEVEDVLKNPKKDFHEIDNPVKGYKLTINTGSEKREVFTNIVDKFTKEQLKGQITTFVLNLPAAVIRGVNSRGMIIMTDTNLVTGGKTGDILI